MRRYWVVNQNQSFSDAVGRLDDQYATREMFDSLEAAMNCGRWTISGAMFIVSYDPISNKGWPGDFKVEVSR